jgi:hypothetical protein
MEYLKLLFINSDCKKHVSYRVQDLEWVHAEYKQVNIDADGCRVLWLALEACFGASLVKTVQIQIKFFRKESRTPV